MAIAIADSWAGRSSSATLDIPVSGFETGDIIVVVTFCAGGGAADVPFDDVINGYVARTASTPDGTFTTSVAIADAVCEFEPTEVSVANLAGGANDVAAVVLRVTHDGTGWNHPTASHDDNVTADDPSSPEMEVGFFGTEYTGAGTSLMLAALTHDGATTTLAPQSGWSDVEEEEDAGSGIPYSVVSKVNTVRVEEGHQWTTGASRDYSIAVAGYSENVVDPQQSDVVTAPSPAVTGLTLEVEFPDLFPDPNDVGSYHVLVTPPIATGAGDVPTIINSEFVRVIGRTGSVFDIERGQEGSRAQAIEAGFVVWWDHIYEPAGQLLLEYAFDYVLQARLDVLEATVFP